MMFFRHPLTLLTKAVPALDLNRDNVCLLLQDLHSPFADAKGGWLAARAKSKVLMTEFQEYFRALDSSLSNITRILNVVRALGLPVIYSCLGYRPPQSPSEFQMATGWTWNLNGPDGTFMAAVHPADSESVFSKPGWGALANAELEGFLRERGIRYVIVAGVLLDFGIYQTCGELADRGIGSLVISDGVASITGAGQTYVRGHAAHGLTKLRSTGEMLDLLSKLEATGNVRI